MSLIVLVEKRTIVALHGGSTSAVLVQQRPFTVLATTTPSAARTLAGVVVQSPPAVRQSTDTSTGSTEFVELVGLDVTMTIGTRLRVRTELSGRAVAGSQDGSVSAQLALEGGPTLQGANAAAFRAAATSEQSTSVTNEFGSVPPGTHRVSLVWMVFTGGEIQVTPVTRPERSCAVLTVEELT